MSPNSKTRTANATQSFESSPMSSRSSVELEENLSRTRLQPREFELLLQRAVEILNARARGAEASGS